MSAKKGLGRGFESLIPVDLLDDSFDPTAKQDEKVSQLRELKLDSIQADPEQPRRVFDQSAIEELADSIKEHGLLQPIVVIPKGSGYMIVAGERRYRAASSLGLATIPAIIRTLSAQHKLELSLIENLQRRDLSAIETATAYAKLRDQFNLTLEQIAKRVGKKSISAVSNTMRLLKLPNAARQAIAEGSLTEGQARPLIGQSPEFIENILPRIISEEWSARRVEQYVVNAKKDTSVEAKSSVNEHLYQARRERLASRLSTDVAIRTNNHGSGQIVIKFRDEDDLQRLEELLGS
ncbi:MAG: parB [Candidatus Saccharibacteria bacterium]|nr:parB [Candidatus Saccharibacteria bacterium]